MEPYRNRQEAGKILSKSLKNYNQEDVIALALPRGGVPVAYEVAKALSIPWGIFIVRKLGVPGHVELAMGAIASGGLVVLNHELIQMLGISKEAIDTVLQLEQEELKRREKAYHAQTVSSFKNKTILLIDDGIATGATMLAAIKALRKEKPKSIVIAAPVAALDTCEELAKWADKIICPLRPQSFQAVGLWYSDFSQTSDEEVYELLHRKI